MIPHHVKKGLGFHSLVRELSECFLTIPDARQPKKVTYSIRDCLMSAMGMMFLQDPSLLQFQRRMQDEYEANNLETLFGVSEIPADTQMRVVIDSVSTEKIAKIFPVYLKLLQRGQHLKNYDFMNGYYLIALDGSEYFTSEEISCPCCLKKESKTGKTRYHHQILQSVLIHPEMRQVIPLAPEPIQNYDGHEKQDCEINAAKRVIEKIRKSHPKMKIIITGDGLYSKQPFIEALIQEKMSFILVAKPDDHKIMYKMIENRDKLDNVRELEVSDDKGNLHIYRWTNGVKLNGNQSTQIVNYFEYELFNQELDKITYKNSWVTNIVVGKDNVQDLVRGGRARWKIENETFNTLKNQGYHIEHNFGHGKNNLSNNFFVLNLLAFFMHEIFQLTEITYQKARLKIGTRLEFFNNLRAFMRMQVYVDWTQFIFYVYDPPKARKYYQHN